LLLLLLVLRGEFKHDLFQRFQLFWNREQLFHLQRTNKGATQMRVLPQRLARALNHREFLWGERLHA
jgi:hypothetical protein